MTEQSEHVDAPFVVSFKQRVWFTDHVFAVDNPVFAEAFTDGDVRVIVFVDSEVVKTHQHLRLDIVKYFEVNLPGIKLAESIIEIPGGEFCKNDRTVFEGVCEAIAKAKLCRRSYVVAVGGGAVLDVVGFAASVAHRGVRLIRIPTTTVAQGDSAVGVKNGINAYGKKNYLGTFAVPWAVINDREFLKTLDDHHWLSGFSETVKVALIKDAKLFEQIEHDAAAIRQRNLDIAWPLIERSAQLHLQHIVETGDPFELTQARPLDLGHWAAHKLEQISDFTLTHGHAVALGLAIDTSYARLAGMLSVDTYQRIIDCLKKLGFKLHHPAMADCRALVEGLDEFREHLGGELTIPLIRGIAEPVEVHEYDNELLQKAVASLL